MLAPGAKMDDGLLDVVVYDGMSDVQLMKHFIAASKERAESLPIHRARVVRITAEQLDTANADSEVIYKKHTIQIEVVPGALTVIAGNGIGLTFPVEATPIGVKTEPAPEAANGAAPSDAPATHSA
jgi:diacylglycerol kinase family enzyme